MLHLFRKSGSRDGSPIDGSEGPIVASHILPKFLKRLRPMEKPRLLDLGRLCGVNIEFFAQRGCKVQVEDLLLAIESTAADETSGATPAHGPGAVDDAPAGGGIVHATDGGAAPSGQAVSGRIVPPGTRPLPAPGTAPETVAAGGSSSQAMAGGAVAAGVLPARQGARPTRRIVLPPRTFTSGLAAQAAARESARRAGGPLGPPTRNAALPTRFDYPDETFDAIVAWDIFNYYEAGTMRLMASEARRILRPGGLLFGYFHARRPDGPDTPRRYRILDEGRVARDDQPGPPLSRHVYQNRDLEKMFAGLTIVELYFLKNSTRELLMEKKTARSDGSRTLVRPATPKPRFTIE
ncbi:MAG TPA: class I SAM-dependent methyltransferase [Candidatus Polarisedimenticolia bacterium]|jgi:hypothetical protein|nr:class I SAM-dependent methyltransferase [Candidatus Polarisedimenticolia bacterium]